MIRAKVRSNRISSGTWGPVGRSNVKRVAKDMNDATIFTQTSWQIHDSFVELVCFGFSCCQVAVCQIVMVLTCRLIVNGHELLAIRLPSAANPCQCL